MRDQTNNYNLIELKGHKKPITNCKFSSDSLYIMSSGQDGTLRLWNPILTNPLIKTYSNIISYHVIDFSITQDNSKFLCCGSDKDSYLVDSQSAKVIRRYHGHTDTINSIAFNQDETLLVSGGLDMTIRIFDINRELIQTMSDSKDSITSVQFVNNKIYSSSVDGVLRIYDIRKGELTSCAFNCAINSFNISFEEKFIAVSCMDNEIKLFDCSSEKVIKIYKGMHISKNFLMKIKIKHNDNGVFVNSEDGKVVYYDFVNENNNYFVKLNDNVTTCLDCNKLHKNDFISGSTDTKVTYWKFK